MRYMCSAVVSMAFLSALLTFSGSFASSALTAEPAVDSGHASSEAGEHGAVDFDFLAILTHHLMDSVIFEWQVGGEKIRPGDAGYENPKFLRRYTFKDEQGLYRYEGGFPMHITRRVMMMIIVATILMLVVVSAARKIAGNPHRINGKLANALEAGFLWVRKDLVEEGMHGHSRSYEHLILSLFFFIFLCNLAGLFPPIGEAVNWTYEAITHTHHDNHSAGSTEAPLIAVWPGVTATGDISVTFALALIPTLMMWGIGFKYQGFKFLWHSVPNGVPWPLFPIMWILEFVVSPIAKGFALTIRLLANMTGGHVIILALVGFIFQVKLMWFGGPIGIFGAAGITMASIGGAIAIYFLELLVSFLQAFIFAMLTALFVGSVMHRH